MLSVSVGELAEFLSGKILCCADKVDELVEHLMVGAMSVDSALTYFRRKPNKAVITGGDRPDIQLAALETSTKCLILTGNLQPSPIILGPPAAMTIGGPCCGPRGNSRVSRAVSYSPSKSAAPWRKRS